MTEGLAAEAAPFGIQAYVLAFAVLGGVPSVITYDNLASAVKKVLGGESREENPTFIA